jgi:hypothetical protein
MNDGVNRVARAGRVVLWLARWRDTQVAEGAVLLRL